MNSMIHPYEELVIKQALNPVIRRRIDPAPPAPNRPRLDLAARAQAAIQPLARLGLRRRSAVEPCGAC